MSTYVKLAKSAAEYFVRTGDILAMPVALPSELLVQRACYIGVYENPGRRLRSLFGEPLPHYSNVAQEIIMNTVQAIGVAAARRVRRADLSYLAYTVSVLGPLQRISDPTHLNPAQYGLHIRSTTGKVAVILPRRVGIESAEDQIATAMRESHIDVRREDVTLYRFDVAYFDT